MQHNRRFGALWTFCLLALSAFLLAHCAGAGQSDGERLYVQHCANCHLENGQGVGALVPPLAGADYLREHREALPCLLVYGLADTIYVNGRLYAEQMPGVPTLSHIEVTNILNYICSEWGNNCGGFQPEEVKRGLEKCGE